MRLLLTEDAVEAARIALLLDSVNRERRQVEAGMMQSAYDQAAVLDEAGHAALLVHGEDWHSGVVGIVAGRLKERHNRPALAAALAEGVLKGSGRSVPGVDLGGAVIAARSHGLLLTGGGHAMAAGFSLRPGAMAGFQAFLNERLAHARALPRAVDLAVEGTLAVAGATVELAQQLERLAPYGQGNEEPVFAVMRARVVRAERIGKDGTTVRAIVEGEGGQGRLKAMLFRAGEGPLAAALLESGAPMHLAGQLRAEAWNGRVTATLFVADAAAA